MFSNPIYNNNNNYTYLFILGGQFPPFQANQFGDIWWHYSYNIYYIIYITWIIFLHHGSLVFAEKHIACYVVDFLFLRLFFSYFLVSYIYKYNIYIYIYYYYLVPLDGTYVCKTVLHFLWFSFSIYNIIYIYYQSWIFTIDQLPCNMISFSLWK